MTNNSASNGQEKDFSEEESQNRTVILRDLESLLQKSINEDLIVVDCKIENLLPKGENYGSTMFKVDAIIKRTKDSSEENLPLVATMLPTSRVQREFMAINAFFTKEMFALQRLAEIYKELEKEIGLAEEDLIDVWPKCYGFSSTGESGMPGTIADDTVILMENLKKRGYQTMNRTQGMDFDHAKLAIEKLAHFHALGMLVKLKKPDYFEEIKKALCFEVPPPPLGNELDDAVEYVIKTICEDKRTAQYEDRIRESFEEDKNFKSLMEWEIVETWGSISHGDFWVNNIMFHHDTNGKINGIKFVDFQITKISSAMKDIPYFMCASLSPIVIDNHFDELLNIYYEELINRLEKLKYDTSSLTRESFDEQLKKDSRKELFHCIMALKFFTVETEQNEVDLEDVKSSVMMTKGSNLFVERSWKIVSKFVEKGWL